MEYKAVETKTSLVFCYGTLKLGYTSNKRLLGDSEFVCKATTYDKFLMVNLGGYPGVLLNGHTEIQGDVYRITPTTLESLDLYEGHPGFYHRELIEVPKVEDKCWIYLLPESYRGYKTVDSGIW